MVHARIDYTLLTVFVHGDGFFVLPRVCVACIHGTTNEYPMSNGAAVSCRLLWSRLGDTYSKTKSPRGDHNLSGLPLFWPPFQYPTPNPEVTLLGYGSCPTVSLWETRAIDLFSLSITPTSVWLFWLKEKTPRNKFFRYCLACLTDSITRRGQPSSAASSASNFFHYLRLPRNPRDSWILLESPPRMVLSWVLRSSNHFRHFTYLRRTQVVPRSLPLNISLVALIFLGSS